MTPGTISLMDGIRNAFTKERDAKSHAELGGPPGIGKSCAACHWAQKKSSEGVAIGWLSLPEGVGSIRFLVMRKHVIVATILAATDVARIVGLMNLCSVVFIDGVNQANDAIMPINWSSFPSLIIRVYSEAKITHDQLILATPWTLEDFKVALNNERFRLSVSRLFLADVSLKHHDSQVFDNEFDMVIDTIMKKSYYAGGSARSMFVYMTADIKCHTKGKINHLLDNLEKIETNPGQLKEINSLFVGCSGSYEFANDFAKKLFLKNRGQKQYADLWKRVRALGGSVKGAIFQHAFEQFAIAFSYTEVEQIEDGRPMGIKEQWNAETEHSFYSHLYVASISEPLRLAIQLGRVIRFSNKFRCPVNSCGCQCNSLETLDSHVGDRHKKFLRQLNEPVNHKKYLEQVAVLIPDSLRALERVDISKAPKWILTKKCNEKMIDIIRVVSDTKADLIQLTVSEYHELSDIGYLSKLQAVLRQSYPMLRARFVVVVPSNGTFRFTFKQKQELCNENIDYCSFRVAGGQMAKLKL